MEGRSDEQARRAAQAARAASGLDPEAAARSLAVAIADAGPLPCLVTPLAAVLEGLGRDDALIALCRQVLEADGDVRERPRWQLRLAEACERRGDLAAAVSAHRAVLDAAPRERRSLRALQRIHRAAGDTAALVRALESELALCAGAEEIQPRLELAALLSGPLARGSEALVHLRRVLDLEPDSDGVLERALALAESLGAAADQIEFLDIAIEQAAAPAARARLLARQAALLAGPLESPARAVDRWQEALALEPGLPGVQEGLRCALERLGATQPLLDSLLEESRSASPEARRALLERGADVAAARGGDDAALPWLARLHAKAPEDPAPLARMAELHRRAGRKDALRDTLQRLAALPLPAGRAAAIAGELASLAPARVCGSAGAPPCTPREPARGAEDPAAPVVLPPPEAPAGGDPALEARLAEAELAGLDPEAAVYTERRRVLQQRLAWLYAGPLADAERALPHLRAIVAIPPGTPRTAGNERARAFAEERLLALLRRDGGFVELEARLAARLARAPADPAGWLELAALREGELHAPAAAADAYREALRHGADAQRALSGLRRSARLLGDWSEVARSLEAELESVAASRGRGAEARDPADEPSRLRRAELLRELGDVAWHRLGATTRASRAFAAALEADPRDLVSLRSLRALLASMEDWRGALDLVESEIELLPPGDRRGRRALWIEAAEIAAERVDDPGRALRALEAADAIAALETAERRRLAALLHRSGDLARYVAIAEGLLAQAPADDADERLRLGRACLALGRPEAARGHAKRAVQAAPQREAAWELLAEAELAQGRRSEAAECLVRAAEIAGPARAVSRLLRAARIVAPDDAEFAHGLCQAACARDPGDPAAWLGRARSAAALGRPEEAEDAAVQAAELALAAQGIEHGPGTRSDGGPDAPAPEALVEIGLAAVASAAAGGRSAAAARILAALRRIDPADSAVLRAQTLVLHGRGDAAGALQAALALFAADPDAGKEPRLLLALAEGLLATGMLDEACQRFEEAVAADPGLEAAWDGLARSLEGSGRARAAEEALDAWARVAPAGRRASCLLRAAELAFARGDRGPGSEARLRQLLAEDPGCMRAAELLAQLLLDAGRADEACEAAAAAAQRLRPGTQAAALERIRARALESLGRSEEACAALAKVLAEDPEAADAAHARAALLRGRGAWQEAAATLEGFLAGVPPGGRVAPERIARTWLDLAALRALPLRDPRGAIEACREAVRACPSDGAAREALADALAGDPAAHDEAVRSHLQLLEDTPVRVASLRALVALAAAAGRMEVAADGRAILRALGAGEEDAPARVGFRSATPCLENPVWERARLLARTLSRELARALGASRTLEPPPSGQGVGAFRLAAVLAESRLTAAALVPLGDQEAHAVLTIAALLAAERPVVSGDGRLVNALAGALGRRARRRAREALQGTAPEEIAEVDAGAFRAALRALAHDVALDAVGGDLGTALRALVDDGEDGRPPDADASFRERVARHPAARELLRRAVQAWGQTLLQPPEAR